MIKLYLDEDVPEAVALALRLRGFDVLTTREADNKGLTDHQQLHFASSVGRVLFSHNVADFARLHVESMNNGVDHRGILLCRQVPIGLLERFVATPIPGADHTLSKSGALVE
jgi:predicted nuclease of predicted toxin-antitoxin system